MNQQEFIPHHINATVADLEGNGDVGRYIFLPGSDARSLAISEHFSNVRVLESPRKHNLYLGTIEGKNGNIDVGAISSGMGTPSLDIIMTELFKLGCKRFLRVGTAGSCQVKTLRAGSLVVGTAAVRDDNTSRLYLPTEFPAVASHRFVEASTAAVRNLGWKEKTRFGIVHSKDSLYAREFGAGPLAKVSGDYMQLMEDSGVLASDMESSHLFVLGSLFNHELRQKGVGAGFEVHAGSVLAIIGDDRPFADEEVANRTVDNVIELAIQTVQQMADIELPAA